LYSLPVIHTGNTALQPVLYQC